MPSPAVARVRILSRVLLGVGILAPLARAADGNKVDFNRDVRPILSGTCLKCHGLDDGSRKAKLRLDRRDGALAGGKSGDPAIVPGKPEESALVQRIESADPDEVMPPSSTKVTLTAAQKQVMRRWVAEGAEYQTHWAFVAPRQVPPPPVKQAGWARNPIDQFVLARLEAQGLHPAPEADRYALARRLSLDLIGLPPTPEEADAFVNDPAPDAYEKLVDRLLASPQYGERWARRWLDLARYADTNGYEKDRPRSIWPYRDWVINALNADLPFDQFTIKQLAGDLLPGATDADRVATGFHRNTMRNEEGGTDPLEFRFYSVIDRANVTGTTWLGLTVGCAQCHTHKYDPITQVDYYSLFAFLNNCDEPELTTPRAENEAKRAAAAAKVAKLKAELPDQWPTGDVAWQVTPAPRVATASGATANRQPDGSWRFGGPVPDKDDYTFTFDTPADPARHVDRLRVEAIADGKKGPGRTPHGNFVLSELLITVAPADGSAAPVPVKLARAEADFAQAGFLPEHAFDGNPLSGWGIDPQEGKSHAATFYFEQPQTFPAGARWTVTLQQQYGNKHTLGHVRLSLGAKAEDPRPAAERRKDGVGRAFATWEKSEAAKAVAWTVLRPAAVASNCPSLDVQPDDSVLVSGDITKLDTYDLTFRTNLTGITALRLEALPDPSLPKNGPGLIYYEGPFGDFALSEITMTAGGQPARFAKAFESFAAANNPAANSIDGNPQTGWMINGGQGKPHQAVFVLAEPTKAAGELAVRLLFERYYACGLGHFRISVTTDPRAAESSALPPAVEAALLVPAASRTTGQHDLLFAHFLSVAPELAEARKAIDAAEKSAPADPTTLVLTERPPQHARASFLHHRGEFLQPKEQVQPNVPGFLPPLPADAPRNRLTLARWLVSRDNPLTARVAVNRQWQAFFGRGIVRTVQDFGYQGEMPSHLELLDWLAMEFVNRGWSLKQIDRLIVTSATYRQSSRVTPELVARDPENVLLARGPRFRVEAEMVRDAALKSAGLLSGKMFGPSVFPPQVPSITTEGAYGPLTWTVSAGEDRVRRSLYTFAKRTAPFAMYNTFDAPSGEACVARREVSNTPLQALTLLNDQLFVEAAQALGKSIAATAQADDERRATDLFRRCLTRPPAPDELTMLVTFVRHERERFAKKELDPAKVAGAGEGDPAARAAWTAAARAVLNLDEAVTKN